MEESQNLSEFASIINNLFGLQEQGRELVTFVAKSIGCKHACLLFLDYDGEYFTSIASLPKSKSNPYQNLKMSRRNPLINYLRQDKKLVTRDKLVTLPLFQNPSKHKTDTLGLDKIALLMPLMSRNRLIGILVLDEKDHGEYTLEEFAFLQSTTNLIATSMEKEYLREQLSHQKEQMSVVNRSSVIMASNLNIQLTFDSFVTELRKIADIDWAAINLIDDRDLYLLALSSVIGSAWKAEERIPIKGTATEWLASHKRVIVELDIAHESQFVTAELHIKQGVRSIAYLPLTVDGRAIGSLIVASRQTNAYDRKQLALVEEISVQIATSVKNSVLYLESERQARVDGLTGLFNRRSLDESIANEINRHSRYGGIFSLIILDLDGGLRTINNKYGHLAGDKALRQIGDVIRRAVRTSDQAFRYGGDEFSILLPNTPIDAANNMVAERVRKQIESQVIADQIPVTASFGLASWPANGKEANEIIAAADSALYYAKRGGGNQSQLAANL